MAIMTYVHSYLDQLVEPMFQRDEQGREVFFPFGLGSRGRIVPDVSTGARIRERLQRFWVVFFVGWIPLIALGSTLIPNIWAMIAIMVMSVGGMWAFTATISRGLEVTGRRMTPRNQMASMLESSSLKKLVWMTVLSLALMLLGVADLLVPAISQGQPAWFKPMAAFTVIFFAATTVMWGLVAVRKWRKG